MRGGGGGVGKRGKYVNSKVSIFDDYHFDLHEKDIYWHISG